MAGKLTVSDCGGVVEPWSQGAPTSPRLQPGAVTSTARNKEALRSKAKVEDRILGSLNREGSAEPGAHAHAPKSARLRAESQALGARSFFLRAGLRARKDRKTGEMQPLVTLWREMGLDGPQRESCPLRLADLSPKALIEPKATKKTLSWHAGPRRADA